MPTTPFLAATVSLVFTWLYHALMESSSGRPPLGKRCWSGRQDMADSASALALRREALRKDHHQHGAYVYGYIMAGFTERKQALHDMLAGCWCCGETVEEVRGSSRSGWRLFWGYQAQVHSKPE